MKKPDVLNRAMFNKGGTSAYGRGITSNLVSDEQRQRFNYGGRVRANVGFYSGNEFAPIERTAPDWNWNFPPASELFGYEERINRPQWMIEREKQEELEGLEDPSDYQVGQDDLLKPEKKAVITDTESDVLGAGIDWETFAEGLYDKKSAKGEAQLGLAGNVLAAAFQPKKEAMAILGKGLGDFGKTATQRKKKMEDIAATGKMYETIYKTREEEKGKQARLTAEEKAAPSTAKETYDASIALVLSKDPTPSDGDIAAAFWNATRVNPIILKGGKKEDDLKADEAAIAGADEEDVFLLNRKWHMKKGGKLVPISEEIALKLKG